MDGLAEHLHDAYDVTVVGLVQLDLGVYRVRLAGGDDWVARVFPALRSSSAVEHDATVLRRLEMARFPAERLAAPKPVTTFVGRPVLVTRFIHGERPRGGRGWAILGALLGAMHSVAADWASPAGAWHHLADGTPRDEIAAATTLLERVWGDVPARQGTDIETLLDELQRLDDGDD